MSHLYVLLVGGIVVRGDGLPDATALAWAAGTVLAIGTDEEVRAVSRGDSTMVRLDGATVIPLDHGEPRWPTGGRLEVGQPADFAVVTGPPSRGAASGSLGVSAVVRAGVVVRGALPGLRDEPQHHPSD